MDIKNARTIYIYEEDLDSLLPDGLMTGTMLDYVVYRNRTREKGIVCSCGSGLYGDMKRARYT
jgi:hypothetical protein